jgi:hypothetical protein
MILLAKRAWLAAAAVWFFVSSSPMAPAQIGAMGAPAGPPPPILNPSSPMIVPAPQEVPVSPASPGSVFGSTGTPAGNAVGTPSIIAPEISAPPRKKARARRHHYARAARLR